MTERGRAPSDSGEANEKGKICIRPKNLPKVISNLLKERPLTPSPAHNDDAYEADRKRRDTRRGPIAPRAGRCKRQAHRRRGSSQALADDRHPPVALAMISSGCDGGVRNRFRSIRVRRPAQIGASTLGLSPPTILGIANPGRSDQGHGLLGALVGPEAHSEPLATLKRLSAPCTSYDCI
jgi:hypothetical protein